MNAVTVLKGRREITSRINQPTPSVNEDASCILRADALQQEVEVKYLGIVDNFRLTI
jgi:hypothetical protein